MVLGTGGSGGCVQPTRKFLSETCDTEVAGTARTALATAASTAFTPRTPVPLPGRLHIGASNRLRARVPRSGPIPRHYRVRRCRTTHDLRRACTRIDPIRRSHKGVDGVDPHVAPRRCAGRDGGRRRLRVRLRGSRRRRDERGGHRGRRLPEPAAPDAVSHCDTDPEAHAHPDTDPETTSEAHTDTETDPEAQAPASPSARHHGPAPGARRRPPAGPQTSADAHAHAETETEGSAPRGPRAVTAPGELSAVPRYGAPAHAPQGTVPGHAHPDSHRARGVRRRGAAPALTPGDIPCRIGLFSPSRWRRRAPSSSS